LAGLATAGPDPTDAITVPTVTKAVQGLLASSGGTTVGSTLGTLQEQASTGQPLDVDKASRAGLVDGSLDLLAGATLSIAGKAIAPFRSSIIPEAAEFADDFARVGKELGSDIPFRITPAQLTRSGALDTIETIAEAAPIGRGGVRDLKKVIIPRHFKQYTDLKLDEIAEGVTRLSAEDIAPILDDAIRGPAGTFTLFKTQARRNYAAVDQLAKGAQIDVKPLKEFAQQQIDDAARIGGRSLTPGSIASLNQVLAIPTDTLSYVDAAALRTSFLDDVPAMELVKDKGVGLTKQLIEKTDNLITGDGAKFGLSEDAEAMRRVANKFYKENVGKTKFGNQAVRKIIKNLDEQTPEKIAGIVFKPGASKTVKIAKDVLGENAFTRLRSQWLDDVILTTQNPEQVLKGGTFLRRMNRMGNETLNAIFDSPQHVSDVLRLGVGAELIQKATGGAGQLVAQQAQFGALIGLAGGAGRGSGRAQAVLAGVIGVPAAFSKIIQSAKASRVLVQGLSLPPGSKQAASILARATKIASDESQRREGIAEQIRRTKRIPSPTKEQLAGFGGRGF
jgi:hypothetical protein